MTYEDIQEYVAFASRTGKKLPPDYTIRMGEALIASQDALDKMPHLKGVFHYGREHHVIGVDMYLPWDCPICAALLPRQTGGE